MQIFKDVYMVGGDDYSVSGTEWPHGDCCCYVIDTGRGLLFFDTGFEETLPEKLEVFRYWGLDPDDVRYVFISHGHLDHFTAAKHFQDRGAQIVSGAYTADLMANGNGDGPDRLALWAFREPEPTPRFIPCKPDIVVDNNDTRDYLGVTVKSIHTAGPGHHHMLGSDGVSLYLATFGPRNILFSGDHILFDRYGHISWSSKEDLPLFDALKAHKIDAILGGHYFLHWRPWPRKCPA
jgi:glyoxylase-like metal-dependent hydrolase (beta-lactamase superfamily II)